MSKYAALVIDMQNGFCSPSGSMGPSDEMTPAYERAVIEAAELTETARENDALIIYLRHVYREQHPEMADTFPFRAAVSSRNALVRNTDDAALCAQFTVAPTDIVLNKSRFDGFLGTELDLILRSRGVTDVVVAGVSTNVCVESTVRSASERGYRAHVASDATAASSIELHVGALRSMEYAFATVGPWREFFAARV